ncbi:MAG: hypothetical protein NTY64_21165 [Deltaproteobacteria bacterium]|nr:hypothetical protein [Deltaproteobacteria bacterium]
MKDDGVVKSPSAALRFTFVATAYHPSTLPYDVLRAGSRETRESFLRSHLFGDFLRDHQSMFSQLFCILTFIWESFIISSYR